MAPIRQQQVFALIRKLTGNDNVIAVPRMLIELLEGDIVVALFLSQLIYWSDKGSRPDGYIYKSYADWTVETGLSQTMLRRARQTLEDRGLVITKLHKANGAPTLHYKVVGHVLVEELVRVADLNGANYPDIPTETDRVVADDTSDLSPATTGLAAGNKSLTETTAETTTETTHTTPATGVTIRKSSPEQVRAGIDAALAGFAERSQGVDERYRKIPTDHAKILQEFYRLSGMSPPVGDKRFRTHALAAKDIYTEVGNADLACRALQELFFRRADGLDGYTFAIVGPWSVVKTTIAIAQEKRKVRARDTLTLADLEGNGWIDG